MFRNELNEIAARGLRRRIRDRDGRQGRVISLGGRSLLNFASNDYLGLAGDEGIASRAAALVAGAEGGAGASRLLHGGTRLHEELERAVARLKDTERALLFNSGYTANAGIIPALAGEGDVLFSDELNHASIVDGCRLSRARKFIYRHCDVDDLALKLRQSGGRRKIVITDSVFSMDGDIAPLDAIYALCMEEGAVLYIDDAHGTGVLGGGRGAVAHFGLEGSGPVIQMGTFSKALGSFGAFLAADGDVIDYVVNRARSFIFSTALPASVVAVSLAAVEFLLEDAGRVERLWSNIHMMHESLDEIGIDRGRSCSQIIPVVCRSAEEALSLSSFLERNGVLVPAVRPPSVREPRLRISVSAFHTGDDIEMLKGLLDEYFNR